MSYLERVFRMTEEDNRRAILDLLPAGRGGALLDVGCNAGELTSRVARRLGATRVVGIELLETYAEAAHRRGIEAIVGDVDDSGLPFGDEEFDMVHSNQVIEHVRRTDRFLSEIRRVLVPGGLACLSTNNLASWHNIVSLGLGYQPTPMHVSDEVVVGNPLDPWHGRAHEKGRTHLRLFTARALSELAEHHGLHTERLVFRGYYPLPPRMAHAAVRIDPHHAAFVIALLRRV
jgi:SAM-dependent methyltransferase